MTSSSSSAASRSRAAGAGARPRRARPRSRKAGPAGRRGRRARRRGAAALRLARRRQARERARRTSRVELDAAATALDVGASTGGFTDCLLQNGRGASDRPRRRLRPAPPEAPRTIRASPCSSGRTRASSSSCRSRRTLVVCDVSFISVRTALPPALAPRSTTELGGARAREAAVRGRSRGRPARAASSATRRCTAASSARSPRPRSTGERRRSGVVDSGAARPEGKPRVLRPPRPPATSPRSPMTSTTGSTRRRLGASAARP